MSSFGSSLFSNLQDGHYVLTGQNKVGRLGGRGGERTVEYDDGTFDYLGNSEIHEGAIAEHQVIAGGKFARLPIGSQVRIGNASNGSVFTKAGPDEWTSPGIVKAWTNWQMKSGVLLSLPKFNRKRVGAWHHAWVQIEEPEDVAKDVRVRIYTHSGGWSSAWIRDDALSMADDAPAWAKPPQCLSLKKHNGVFVQCTGTPTNKCAKHGAPFSPTVLTWTDEEEDGRAKEGTTS